MTAAEMALARALARALAHLRLVAAGESVSPQRLRPDLARIAATLEEYGAPVYRESS